MPKTPTISILADAVVLLGGRDKPLDEKTIEGLNEVLKVAREQNHDKWLCMESCCGNFMERSEPK